MGCAHGTFSTDDIPHPVRGEPRVDAVDNAYSTPAAEASAQDEAATPKSPREGTSAEVSWEDVLAQLGEPAAGGVATLSADDEKKTTFANKKQMRFGDLAGLADVHIGFSCRKGLKPESPNQDAFAIVQLPELSLYLVADGHGQKGHAVAQWAADALPKRAVLDRRLGTAETAAALCDGFKNTQDGLVALSRSRKVNCNLSGATCTAVVHDRSRQEFIVANVGTDRAVLGCGADMSKLTAVQLTAEHKPDMAAERERIEKAGGRVVFDGYANHHVYAKNARYPGLPMSRCLGDVLGHQGCGISATPDVQQRSLDAADRLLLVCSDGVWEVMTPQEAVDLVANIPREKASVAADSLIKEAWDRWIDEEGGAVVDDITAIVVFLM